MKKCCSKNKMAEPIESTSTNTIGISVGRNLIVHNGKVTSVILNEAPKAHKTVTHFRQFESPTPYFTGRDDLLEQLHSLMSSCQTKSNYMEKIIVLYGDSGIGKSELARIFAKICVNNPAIRNVAWINGGSLETFTSSFTALARKLKLITETKSIEETVSEVYTHFSDHVKRGLFIFDNAREMNDEEFDLKNYMPDYLDNCPLFLITTRYGTWDEIPQENKIYIQKLSHVDAVSFLVKRIQLSAEQQHCPGTLEAIEDLVKTLHGNPMALALAGSSIPNPKMGWMDLKENIKKYIGGNDGHQADCVNHRKPEINYHFC